MVGRDAVIFPEVVAVADALLDPVMAQLVWADSGGERPRPLWADGKFCRRLGERVGRPWLGPLIAVDYGGPLVAWMGAVIRLRRRPEGRSGPYARFDENLWWVRQEHQPSSMAAGLRVLTSEKKMPGSGTNWRAVVPAEQRFVITNLLGEAEEQLQQLRGAQVGTTAEVARSMLEGLNRGTDLLDQMLGRVMVAAVNTGVRAAAPDAVGSGVPAGGAWAARIPPLASGVFRVRPRLFEGTASYLERLAHAYRLTLFQLLDGCGIAVHGHGTAPTAGLVLSLDAVHRVTILSQIPISHLARALPHLTVRMYVSVPRRGLTHRLTDSGSSTGICRPCPGDAPPQPSGRGT
ncbi:hypothetical protein [Streptomyces sp. NPDC001750]|uniref:hypothetical protein n=1 Tax=Streptomyces sp. NPDC001750 TaxID=3364607 RepID=UPI0036769DE7